MKKLLIISISIMIILALSISVMAKADVQNLVPFTYANWKGLGEPVTFSPDASGKAIVNNSMGDVVLEITVSAKGLDPGELYTVSLIATGTIWFSLGEFTTNANGNGHFHINLSEEDLTELVGNKESFLAHALEHVVISIGDINNVSWHAVLMEEDF